MKYRIKIIETISEKERKTKNGKKIEIIEVERDFPVEKLEQLCQDFYAAWNGRFRDNSIISCLNNKAFIKSWLEKNS